MEVTPIEAEKIKTIIKEWFNYPEHKLELESTFGSKGVVDETTFLAVAARLHSRGFEYKAQEDRMTIILPERIRFTLTGPGIIQQYCRDDTLEGKPFIAIIKDSVSTTNNIDLKEYDVRIKARREQDLASDNALIVKALANWKNQRKAFRVIKRWTFVGNGVRFDMSITRSTFRDPKGEFKWVRSFKEQKILATRPTYEIEVELVHTDGETEASSLKNLISGIGEVLKGIQKNNLLVTKTQKQKVLAQYKELTGADTFRGVQPKTLERDNFNKEPTKDKANIRSGYNVTDKADGLRAMGYCDPHGELFLIDNALNVYKTGLQREKCKNTLLDGEWITKDSNGDMLRQYMIFDIYHGIDRVKTWELPFREIEGKTDDCRYKHMKLWEASWNEGDGPEIVGKGVNILNKLIVGLKTFEFGRIGDESIFKAAQIILNKKYIYHTDGLIFTPNFEPLPEAPGVTYDSQFKWKPAEENTVDFLVRFEKDPEYVDVDKVTTQIHPETGELIRYKTMKLYVGSAYSSVFTNPQAAILYEEPIPDRRQKEGQKGEYKPILFNPSTDSDPMSCIAYGIVEEDLETSNEFVMTEVTKEPIYNSSVVEMRYDLSKPRGWRWIPIRVRHDKTEKLARGIIARTLNSERTARSVWDSIHNPITHHMITTGNEEPLESEMDALRDTKIGDTDTKYYDADKGKEDHTLTHVMREFHNKWIKNKMLFQPAFRAGARKLIDVACGKAGDLYKWIEGSTAVRDMKNHMYILGIDYSSDNIRNVIDGAYKRYIQAIIDRGRENIPKCLFLVGDSTKNLMSGEAGMSNEDADMMKYVFGQQPENRIPSYVEKNFTGVFRKGADVMSCMFAIHYMFETKEKLDGFIRNIAENLSVKGFFIGCCFDGDKVFNMLKNMSKGDVKTGKHNDTTVWTITKQYDETQFNDDDESVGLAIDVQFMSLGTEKREYLVSFPYLVKRMREIGCELLSDEEARYLGLSTGTNMFESSHAIAFKEEGKRFDMPECVKEYSFLNRWFIFKRISTTQIELEVDEKEPIDLAADPSKDGEVVMGDNKVASQRLKSFVSGVKTVTVGTSDIDNDIITSDSAALYPEEDSLSDKMPMGAVSDIESRRAAVKESGIEEKKPVINANRKFKLDEIFRIGENAPITKDYLKIGNKYAPRYMALIQPFPIKDSMDVDGKVIEYTYPSIQHYIAAMRYKHATNKPGLAPKLFNNESELHQKYIRMAQAEKKLTDEKKFGMLLEEMKDIVEATSKSVMSVYKVEFDENKWLTIKDKVLREGLEQRYKLDKIYRDIVDVCKTQQKYILYSVSDLNEQEYGGQIKKDGSIVGANKVGKFIMEMANFNI